MRRSPRRSSLSRRIAILAAAFVATAALCVPAASASRFLQVGLFDDAQFNYGNPDKVFPVLRQLRTQIIRVSLVWGGPNGVAKRRPLNPANPNDPAYDWSVLRPHGELCATERDQGRLLDHRDAAVGERRRRRQRRTPQRARSRTFRDGGGPPVQRHLRRARRTNPAGRAQLARVERAEQPGLPPAAVPQGRRQVRDPECDRLREDLQRGRKGRSEDDRRRFEGRVRRDGPSGEQQSERQYGRRSRRSRSCGR